MKKIKEIASQLHISEEDLILYGNYKAKVPLKYINTEKFSKNNLILVSAISPTPAGEGKTTVSIGLTQGMNRIDSGRINYTVVRWSLQK
jgi:formate--tetrahydrofolate ligase